MTSSYEMTEWNLSELFESFEDPALERSFQELEKNRLRFGSFPPQAGR